ncbi:hypothetical protein EC973_004728 [Apophysomyces ossiformis]|uniref:Uncharacterized protein n=1 Tax=Apophysomyces ossiformis TaxID=679940 RepID=A0A8H7BFT0_9FUNG|nr:hypothetical protein EC973_004728 [Apophysomyces ossiformis]
MKRELRRQLRTKCENQWERTWREVGAVLLDMLEGEFVRIRGKAGRVDDVEDDDEAVDVEGW